MAKFDKEIAWLRQQMAYSAEAILDIKGGQKIELNDRDVSEGIMHRHEDLIKRYKDLIVAYEKRNV